VILKEEHIFVAGFCRQYMILFLTQHLDFLLMKRGFYLSGYVSAKNNRCLSSVNPIQIFEVPLHGQKIGVWCAITAT
jgi:hypothetical protein